MNRRTTEAVEYVKREVDLLQRSADSLASSTNAEILAARKPMLERASHLRHLVEIAEAGAKASAAWDTIGGSEKEEIHAMEALDALVNAEADRVASVNR